MMSHQANSAVDVMDFAKLKKLHASCNAFHPWAPTWCSLPPGHTGPHFGVEVGWSDGMQWANPHSALTKEVTVVDFLAMNGMAAQ